MSAAEKQERYDAKMHLKYYDPVERFPDRIDELLEKINQVHIDIS